MAYDAKTERLIALKKLAGKAQTSNDKGLANEGLPSGITSTSETIFGNPIPTSPDNTNLYDRTGTGDGQVEYVRFPVSFIAGSDTVDGRHGFELKLPSDYESNSTNPKRGTYPYINDQAINITSGSLQLIPPSFAPAYEAKPFFGGTGTKNSGTQIPLLDARDWYLDYFNGIYFQQDPPGTGDHSDNPDFVEGFLYIGSMLNTVVSNAGGGGGGAGNGDKDAQYLVLAATGSLSAERVFNPTTGLNFTDGGAGNNYTVEIDNSVVATLTGSQFSGNVGVTGSIGVTLGVTGSLTSLTDGTPYLRSGAGISITTGSSGEVTVASTGAAGLQRSKDVYFVTGALSAGSSYNVYEPNFVGASYDFEKIDVFINGQLLHSGSSLQVSDGDRDYYIDSATSLKFAFQLEIDDILDIVVFTVTS